MRPAIRHAFTLIEIMIVLVLIAILASFAIPRLSTSFKRSYARVAIANLNLIHAANLYYRLRNGFDVNASTAGDLSHINSALELKITSNGVTYSCTDAGTCVATGSGFTATLTLADPLSDSNPSCPDPSCP